MNNAMSATAAVIASMMSPVKVQDVAVRAVREMARHGQWNDERFEQIVGLVLHAEVKVGHMNAEETLELEQDIRKALMEAKQVGDYLALNDAWRVAEMHRFGGRGRNRDWESAIYNSRSMVMC